MLRKFMQATYVALISFASVLAANSPSSAETLDQVRERGDVRVGMLVDFAPFGFLNETGKPDGFDYDIAKALADHLGVKLEIVQVTGPNRIPYLLSKKVDIIIASLAITDERKKQVAFTSPYAAMLNVVYGDKKLKVAQPSDLDGKTIAVTRASVQETAVAKVAPKGATVQKYDDDASAVQALLSGQSELVAVDTVTIDEIEKKMPSKFDVKFELYAQTQGIALRPSDEQFLAYVNSFISDLKKSGELDKIHRKWFRRPLPDAVSK